MFTKSTSIFISSASIKFNLVSSYSVFFGRVSLSTQDWTMKWKLEYDSLCNSSPFPNNTRRYTLQCEFCISNSNRTDSSLKLFIRPHCGDVRYKDNTRGPDLRFPLTPHWGWREEGLWCFPLQFWKTQTILNGCCHDIEGYSRRLVVLCGCSLWLIITIILNLIGWLTERRSEEADLFSLGFKLCLSRVHTHLCFVLM